MWTGFAMAVSNAIRGMSRWIGHVDPERSFWIAISLLVERGEGVCNLEVSHSSG